MTVGFTLDEAALKQSGFHWFDHLLSQDLAAFVELSPEKRAASLDLYLEIKRRLEEHQLRYQLHLPYFVHPSDYHINSLPACKQKIVKTLEKWLTLTEKIRYNDQKVPIIVHPAHQDESKKNPEDLTADFLDIFLNLLNRLGLSKHYALALENLPTRNYISFGTSLDGLFTFRSRFFNDEQLSLCLDLCHFESSKDTSVIPYRLIDLYHIHQYDPSRNLDHLSLQGNDLDFKRHFEQLKKHPSACINLELLQYAEPHYTDLLHQDLALVLQSLKD